MFPKIRTIKENELPGDGVYNPLALAIRNMHSISDSLQITMGNDGGLQFDLLPDANIITLMMGLLANGEGIYANFCGRLVKENGVMKLVVKLGRVFWPPSTSIAVNDTTISNITSGRKVWCAITANAASIQNGSAFPNFVTVNNGTYTVNVRLMETVTNNNALGIKYHHVGDIFFAQCPYFWISGFDPTVAQSLDHNASGGLVWTTYGPCNQKQ